MLKINALLSCLFAALSAQSTLAQSRDARDCIGYVRNEQPSKETVLGWLVNNCADKHVAVVHQFDFVVIDNKYGAPWCAGGLRNEWHLPTADILEPGEKLGVGWLLYGLAKRMEVAACEVDTSKNNEVFFIMQQPEFLFEADCKYQCR